MTECCKSGWITRKDGYAHCDQCDTRLYKLSEIQPDDYDRQRERLTDLCAPGWDEVDAEREYADYERAR